MTGLIAQMEPVEMLLAGILACAGVISSLWLAFTTYLKRDASRRDLLEKENRLQRAELKEEIKELRVENKACLEDRLELWKAWQMAQASTCSVLDCSLRKPNDSPLQEKAATKVKELEEQIRKRNVDYDAEGSTILR